MLRKLILVLLPAILSNVTLAFGNNTEGEPGCNGSENAQAALIERSLDAIGFKGSYLFTQKIESLNLISTNSEILQVDGMNIFKLVVIPLEGASLKSTNSGQGDVISSAIFHRPSSIKMPYTLNDKGCLLILRQEDPVTPGNKKAFHYSHLIHNINPYSKVTAHILNKEIVKND